MRDAGRRFGRRRRHLPRPRSALRAIGFAASLIAAAGLALPAQAAPSVVRDAEIEGDIRALSAPVWRIAGLEGADVGIYLV